MPVVPRPVLREVALLAAVAAALTADGVASQGRAPSPLGLLVLAGTIAVLAARHRAPLATVPATCLAIAACLATLDAGDTVVLPGVVAAYAAAAHGDRRRSPALIVVLVPVVILLVLAFSSDADSTDPVPVEKLVVNVAATVAAVLMGDATRSRRRARAAEEARRAQEEREREHDAGRRLAEERLTIARDVHDVVAHSIVAINVQAGVAAHLLRTRPEHAEAALLEIKRVSGAALTDLRATLGLLRTDDDPEGTPLRPTDPLGRLDGLADPLRAAGLSVDVAVEGDASGVPVAVGTAAFRIVQEALTNVLRHAGAAGAAVRVAVGTDAVSVLVTDDGGATVAAGPPTPTPGGSGAGLRGMRERAAAVGGTAEAGPADDGTWTVRARLPLPAPGAGS
jgi:signal transduction histidine kinase